MSEAIAKLNPAEESDGSGYSPDEFIYPVKNDDGCDTRQLTLIAEATVKPKAKQPDCSLEGGEWASYFDGVTTKNSEEVAIDHTVPLAEAWRSGASTWDAKHREAFANDVDYAPTLSVVSVASAKDKGDKGPDKWMPTSKEAHCVYAGNWIATKIHWGLTADKAEIDALTSLKPCQKLVMQWKGPKD